jgi:tetratricopeptide (TPR) repeat protein
LVGERLKVLQPADTVTRALTLTNAATALAQLGRYEEAEPRLREAAALFAAARGESDQRVASALQPLAGALLFQGRYAEAESVATRAWQINVAEVGPQNPVTLLGLRMLINILAEKGDCTAAIPHAQYIVDLRTVVGDADVSLNTAMLFLGWCQAKLGNPQAGVRWMREGLRLRKQVFPVGHWAIANAESMVGEVVSLLGTDSAREAEQLLRDGYIGMRRELDSTHVRVRQGRDRLNAFLVSQGRPAEP